MPKGQMPKGPRGMMLGAKGKVKKGTLKRLLQYVTKKHKKQMVIVLSVSF